MSQNEFESKINELNKKFQEANGYEAITLDGPLNIQGYLKSPMKILWVLKEAYGEAFSYTDYFSNQFDKFYEEIVLKKPGPGGTWQPITITSYCILNKLKEYDVSIIQDKEIVKETLENIAFINIKKIPGKSKSNDREIKKYYHKYPALLHEQINLLNPEIIICGKTGHLFDNTFSKEKSFKKYIIPKSTHCFVFEGRFYICAYHPARWPMTQSDEDYTNSIVFCIKKWLSEIKNQI